MNEEEIAIETLKEVASDILNVIEKLQKEIKHQKQQREYWRDNFYEQQNEIEEKTTIIMAGAEKVKQLEKEIEALEIIHNTYKEMIEENNYISKDKIRKKMREIMGYTISSSEERHCQNYAYDRLKELLEEN